MNPDKPVLISPHGSSSGQTFVGYIFPTWKVAAHELHQMVDKDLKEVPSHEIHGESDG